MEDDKLIELFFARDENAIMKTAEKYSGYIKSVAKRVLNDDRNVEECENDTYLAVWDNIPPERPKYFKLYLGAICRKISLNRYDTLTAEKRGGGVMASLIDELSDALPDGSGDVADAALLKIALESFLRGIDLKERQIFIKRYWNMQSPKEIAADLGMNENTVRVISHRTRKKLKSHLEKQGF